VAAALGLSIPASGLWVRIGKNRKMMKPLRADDAVGEEFVALSEGTDGEDTLMKIGDMAKAFDVTLRALRFYEDKGLLSPIREGSMRLYTRRDRARLKLVLLGRKLGFSLREVKQMIDLYDPTGSNAKQLRLTLEKSEKQLGRLQKQRTAIDEAIAELNKLMTEVRRRLSERTVASSNPN
jgi:DNA-binding transcriptional MerR regulator